MSLFFFWDEITFHFASEVLHAASEEASATENTSSWKNLKKGNKKVPI